MAFNLKYWAKHSVSANTKAPAIYTYMTTDNSSAILAAGYFNSLKGILKLGDFIYVSLVGPDYAEPLLAGGIVRAVTPNIEFS